MAAFLTGTPVPMGPGTIPLFSRFPARNGEAFQQKTLFVTIITK
jgi:hypothetical protein